MADTSKPYRVAVVVASDRAAAGVYADACAPAVRDALDPGSFHVEAVKIVPDERRRLARTLRELADGGGVDLLLTCGGTGFAPRDVTPEATAAVIERPVPGLPEAMRQRTAAASPAAYLSRGVAGIRGRCLIVNLPGSPKAVGECLAVIAGLLPHALDLLRSPPGANAGH